MKAVSWFSGVGMFDLALVRAGFAVIGACEIDRFARKVYAARHGVPAFFPEDITHVRANDVPVADLWIAGSPCQGFSVAGKRAGLDDDRSGLLRTWIELVHACRPRWVILENVPGILSANEGRDFGELLGALGDRGYRWAYRVLDGQHFGVAQRRRRVFVVAHLGDGADPAAVLFEPEGVRRDLAARGEKRARAAGRAARGAGAGGEVANAIARSAGHHGRSSPRGDGSDNLVVSALGASQGGPDDNDAQGNRLVAVAFVKRGRRSAGADGSGETWGSGGGSADPQRAREPHEHAGDGAGERRRL